MKDFEKGSSTFFRVRMDLMEVDWCKNGVCNRGAAHGGGGVCHFAEIIL